MNAKSETHYRAATLERKAIDPDTRRAELSFSSEEPYERSFGNEVLGHGPGEVRTGFIASGRAPLLLNHDARQQIGVVESVTISNSKGRAVVRLGRSPLAEEVLNDLTDGIRVNVSVGYRVHSMKLVDEPEDGPPLYRVTDWEPIEVSIVGVPADMTVGVGRSDSNHKFSNPMENELLKKGEESAAIETRDLDPKKHRDAFQERNRCRTITRLGDKYDCQRLAAEAIDAGTSEQEFRNAILDRLEQRSQESTPSLEGIGLSAKERQRYSLANAIRAMVAAKEGHSDPWRGAGLEREVSAHLERERTGESRGGIIVPGDALVPTDEARQLVRAAGDPLGYGTGNATGSNLVPTDHRADLFIEALRNRVVTTRLGVRMIPGLTGQVDIPKEGTQPTFAWVAEDAAPTGSDADMDKETMAFKTLGSWQRLTRRLLKQSSPYVEDLIRNSLIAGAARGIQQAIINGAGTATEPRGILNIASLATVALGTDGAAPDWDAIVGLTAEVANDNADVGSLGFLTNSRVKSKLLRTEKFSGTNGDPIWSDAMDADGLSRLAGYRAAVTNAVPSNLTKGSGTALSAIIFGNFADVLVGMWGGVEIVVDTATHISTGGVILRLWQDVDIAHRHDESFAAIIDAVTT